MPLKVLVFCVLFLSWQNRWTLMFIGDLHFATHETRIRIINLSTQLFCNIRHRKQRQRRQEWSNDLTIGWQNLNLLSHSNTTLAPQARQAKASGENLNYMTLVPQPRPATPSREILNYSLSRYSDILVRSLEWREWTEKCVLTMFPPHICLTEHQNETWHSSSSSLLRFLQVYITEICIIIINILL